VVTPERFNSAVVKGEQVLKLKRESKINEWDSQNSLPAWNYEGRGAVMRAVRTSRDYLYWQVGSKPRTSRSMISWGADDCREGTAVPGDGSVSAEALPTQES